jgi:Rne/Rng family ribonuclease
MAKEICISSTPHETRLAILEDDQLAEIYYERENEYTLAGSIYNGRVTRVLPGMQSAFVDVGLERDAFLYVTDFMELEDPEEADELEKAAVTGSAQAPREIRHTNGVEPAGQSAQGTQPAPPARNGGRSSQKSDQKQESRPAQGRPPREPRLSVEAIPESDESSQVASESSSGDAQDDSTDPGAKRWRGRRRRRGGRGGDREQGPAGSRTETDRSGTETAGSQTEFAESVETYPHESEASQVIHAAASKSPAQSSGAFNTPVPFVLPGESLRKYGGASVDEAPASASSPQAPARPASTFKPATLIEAPPAWDGSGLLPGESLSKHRGRQPEPGAQVQPQETAISPDEFEEEELVTERAGSAAGYAVDASPEGVVPHEANEYLTQAEQLERLEPFAEDQFEESVELSPDPLGFETNLAEPDHVKSSHAKPNDADDYTVETTIDEPSNDETLAESVTRQDESEDVESGKPDPDASASHHVDPARPTGFRLFGLGGKKKTEEPAPPPPTAKTSSVAVSSYAPGSGLIEEEVIEGEEFDAPHHHGKAEEHDLEDYEEETLPNQIRSGDLGELLQEAHLDHKIQLNFDGKNGEEEDGFDDEDDEEESAAAGQPASGQGPARPARDRGARGGRQGRGPQGQNNRRGGGPSRRSMQTSDLPIISDLLKPGQEILVQIAKEPIAKKGARITSHIALPGRFLVFMPTVSHVGVSRKIASDEERHRLKRILTHERGEASGGFIVRTAAEGASEEDLRADLRFLIHLWDEIKSRSESSKSPALIYHDLSLIERILRDQVSANFSSIWVDSQEDYERIVRFLNRFSPSLVRRVKLYTKEVPLFEHFGIQDEISKALRSKVWLKSGGSIVINQTEALVAIDINTGKYVGKSARLEDTIVKTNLDAVPEIVRQIRLRDLGGIIVIDFIDMDERKNRFKVLAALEEALKADRAPTKVLQFNDFGLVAITRKRVKQSLERTLSVPCPTCQATGMVKSPTTVCNEIYTELRKMKKHFENADVLLRVNPETVKVLKSNNASWLTEFEELVGKNILVKSDATLHAEQFDIQG